MSPVLLFPIAILTPFLLAAVMLIPTYAGIFAASYIVYDTGAPIHPLADKASDIFYILDVYVKLFSYWSKNAATLDVIDYALPILVLPTIGGLIAGYATFRVTRGMLNLFRLSTSIT